MRKSHISYIYVHLLKATDNFMKLTGLQWDHAMTHCMRIKGTHLYSVPTCAIWNGIQEPMYIHTNHSGFRSEALYSPLEQKLKSSEMEQNTCVKAPTLRTNLLIFMTCSFFNESTSFLVPSSCFLPWYQNQKNQNQTSPPKMTKATYVAASFMALWQCFQILNTKRS